MTGFIPYQYLHGNTAAWQYLPAAAETVHIGETLYISSGKLTKASGTTAPEYICMTEVTASAGDLIPVVELTDDVILEAELSANVSGLAAGVKVKMDTYGMSVAALGQSETGVLRCISAPAATAGTKCYFKKA